MAGTLMITREVRSTPLGETLGVAIRAIRMLVRAMEVVAPVEVTLPPHGVAVLESRHRADFFMPWRSDPFGKVLYFIGGRGRLCLEDRECVVESERMCLVPPG